MELEDSTMELELEESTIELELKLGTTLAPLLTTLPTRPAMTLNTTFYLVRVTNSH